MKGDYQIYISAKVAESINEKTQYIKNKAFDEEAYQKWIISYLETYHHATKNEITQLLSDKLPNTLNNEKKDRKVRYLLQKMRVDNIIIYDAHRKLWTLNK